MPRFADVLERVPERVGLDGTSSTRMQSEQVAVAPPYPDRALITVVLIDIVGPTEEAVELGDVSWVELVHLFQRLVRTELRRYSGREVDPAGDGFFVVSAGPGRGALRRGGSASPLCPGPVRSCARRRCGMSRSERPALRGPRAPSPEGRPRALAHIPSGHLTVGRFASSMGRGCEVPADASGLRSRNIVGSRIDI